MAPIGKDQLLRRLPKIGRLLDLEPVRGWTEMHPRQLVADCLRGAVDEIRERIRRDEAGRCGSQHVTTEAVLALAEQRLEQRTRPHLREAINATGIILHTGLGRAVLPEGVVESVARELPRYVTLAIDRQTGLRSERDGRIEYLLTELTGAGAATVVNNNAAATMIALTAVAADREVIVSRGQLIEIGGSFRLPDVMAQSRARLVEVGTTNRTHLRDYASALTEDTAAIMRVHPSNYRITGFTSEVPLADLVKLAHSRGLVLLDDLGAGALLDMAQFGLPHEPTAAESIAAGADVVLFSADKLIGGPQGGILVGRPELIERIRRHPLARALRPDKTCLMALERTLFLFRDPQRLCREHPLYRMLTTASDVLRSRAERLARDIRQAAPAAEVEVDEDVGYLGSGSLPMEALPTYVVRVSLPALKADELARRLRADEACVFGRLDSGRLVLDVRTLWEEQVPLVAAAMGRVAP